MKKLILILLALSSQAFASQVQINAVYNDSNQIASYFVRTFNGDDQKMIETKYTLQAATDLFGFLLSGSALGLSSDPDRVYVNFDGNGNLVSVDAQATNKKTSAFEHKILTSSYFSDIQLNIITGVKTDLEGKTGKQIDGPGK